MKYCLPKHPEQQNLTVNVHTIIHKSQNTKGKHQSRSHSKGNNFSCRVTIGMAVGPEVDMQVGLVSEYPLICTISFHSLIRQH